MIRFFRHRRQTDDIETTAPEAELADSALQPDDGQAARTDSAPAPAPDTDEGMDKVVERYVNDEEDDEFGEISFKSFLGAELLASRFFQRQVLFILFVAVLLILYTGNRYSSQHEIIVIDSLKVRLQQERYNVLTQSSELLNLSRQSNIERALRANGDSAIVNPTTPPYEIIVDQP